MRGCWGSGGMDEGCVAPVAVSWITGEETGCVIMRCLEKFRANFPIWCPFFKLKCHYCVQISFKIGILSHFEK